MGSITFWSRLEPRPRSENFQRGLMAEIRDPLWFLTRQWQTGEFNGDDGGSIVHAEMKWSISEIKKYASKNRGGSRLVTEFPSHMPLETIVENEKLVDPSLKIRVQMGQNFQRMLIKKNLDKYIEDFKTVYHLELPSISLEPEEEIAIVGKTLTIKGEHFAANSSVTLTYDGNMLTTNPTTITSDAKGAFSAAFEVPSSTADRHAVRALDKSGNSASSEDDETKRYFMFMSGRVIDGFKLKLALDKSLTSHPAALPPNPVVADVDKPAMLEISTAFHDWCTSIYSQPSNNSPDCWIPERLEYDFSISSPSLDGNGETVLVASEYSEGSLDWYSFSIDPDDKLDPQVQTSVKKEISTFLPANLKFRGMPNRRWWDFEDEVIDFGAIDADKRDIGKLIVMDFALISGNDWFLVPLPLPIGSLARIDSLIVTDVFGERLLVRPLDETFGEGYKGWSMFKISHVSKAGKPLRVGDFLFLPPSLGPYFEGPPIEKVNFIRDEMANMVWAVEHLYEGKLGDPISGHESYVADRATISPPPKTDKMRYIIQTDVPRNWVPFIPVHVPGSIRAVDLQLASMFNPRPGISSNEPKTKILKPEGITEYRIKEEEIPRAGTIVTRSFQRARWTDGSTYLWIGRRKTAGRGEGSSGLRFDVIDEGK